MQHIVIVGATSTIARECALIWAKRSETSLHLVGRDDERLLAVRSDLLVRFPEVLISTHTVDFLDARAIDTLVSEIGQSVGIDKALVAHGFMPDQLAAQADLSLLKETLEVSGVSPILFAESFAKHFFASDSGTLGVISSVADVRGRRKNYIYGSTKAMISYYLAGLAHRAFGTSVKIISLKPGPTATPMTGHLPNRGLAKASKVAAGIVEAMDGPTGVVYLPKIWRLITLIIGLLPTRVFNRLNL